MLLYRYFKSHAFDALRDSRLRVSAVTSFNDPFECMYVVTGTMTEEKASKFVETRISDPSFLDEVASVAYPNLIVPESAKKQYVRDKRQLMINALVGDFEKHKQATMAERESLLDETLRVACFSAGDAKEEHEILMWSHYSNSHKGVRIGFEMPTPTKRFKILPVIYQASRVEFDLSENSLDAPIQEALRKSIITKSNAWAYEREHRLLTVPDLCTKGKLSDGTFGEFIPIESIWVRRIDFGTRIDETEKHGILELVAQRYPHVECFQARYHATDYSLEYEPCELK